MPKTPIHEYSQLMGGKDEIRLPRNRARMQLEPGYSSANKGTSQFPFGGAVPFRADARHILFAVFWRKVVHG